MPGGKHPVFLLNFDEFNVIKLHIMLTIGIIDILSKKSGYFLLQKNDNNTVV